jgi:hypothetical protein
LEAALPTAGRYAQLAFGEVFPLRAGNRIRTGDVQLGKPNRPRRKPLKTSHFQRTKPRFARRFVLRRAPPSLDALAAALLGLSDGDRARVAALLLAKQSEGKDG